MEFTNWDLIITLIIASYGAILSTYSVWSRRQEQKPKLKVSLNYGFTTNSVSVTFKSKSLPQGKQPFMLISSAVNVGKKPVTITMMGLVLPTKDKKFLSFAKQPNSRVSFPYELIEGKFCDVYFDPKEIVNELKPLGYSGKISLKGYYQDAMSNKYLSESLKFDMDNP